MLRRAPLLGRRLSQAIIQAIHSSDHLALELALACLKRCPVSRSSVQAPTPSHHGRHDRREFGRLLAPSHGSGTSERVDVPAEGLVLLMSEPRP